MEEQQLRIIAAVANTLRDAVLAADAGGRIRFWNDAAARLFGYSPPQVLHRPLDVLAGGDSGIGALLHEALAAPAVIERAVRAQTADGRLVETQVAASPVRGHDDRPSGAVFVFGSQPIAIDAPVEQRLRAAEARWHAVVESAVDGIVVIDARGLVESMNPAAERLFGYAAAEVVGQNVSMLMPQPYRSEHDDYIARYLREGDARVIGIGREVTGRRRDGTTFPLHLSVAEVAVGGERRFTGILHDLSERVRMEAQLREQAALVKLGEMAAVIAHEVKNPLAGVRGAIQVLGGRLPHDAGDVRIVHEIIGRLDALTALVNDLLLFARPPQPKPVPTQIVPLLSLTADLLGSDPALREVDIRVQVEGEPPSVTADPGLLRIVFLNLLVNSAQAMKGQGRVEVTVQASASTCVLTFHDSGPGIPLEHRDRVFTPFFTTKSRGTGLGLPTAKRLVEAHAGSIAIDCPASGGTIVTIALPAGMAGAAVS